MVVLGNASKMSAADHPPDAIHVDEIDHFHDDWEPPFDFRGGVSIRADQKVSDHYDVYEEIGEGKFGKVYRCVEKATGLTLAAKFIKLKKDADLEKVEREVQIMTKMRHKCIAQIYDAFVGSNNDVILIMEIVSGGELFDRVCEDYYVLTETAVAIIMYQICMALDYIHSQNIIHLDLKPENIMCVSQTGNQIKLIDFGLAQHYDGSHDLLLMAGTPEFAAPEVIKYEPLDFHTDMWSVGVIAYILLSGESPFLGDNIAETYCNVERGKYAFCEQFEENGISAEARNFIAKLLLMDKSQRMLPKECLQHEWIVKSLERSRDTARRKSQQEMEKRLDTHKLKSYLRKKQFRAMRLMNTLRDQKSEAGVQYVRNMLNAVQNNQQDGEAPPSLVKSAFAKKKRNETGENAPPPAHETKPSTSREQLRPDAPRDVLQIPVLSTTTDSESSRPSSPKPAKRLRDKADKPKRLKSTSRKASSSEQAAKKPKQGSSGGMLLKPPESIAAVQEKTEKIKRRPPSPKLAEPKAESMEISRSFSPIEKMDTSKPEAAASKAKSAESQAKTRANETRKTEEVKTKPEVKHEPSVLSRFKEVTTAPPLQFMASAVEPRKKTETEASKKPTDSSRDATSASETEKTPKKLKKKKVRPVRSSELTVQSKVDEKAKSSENLCKDRLAVKLSGRVKSLEKMEVDSRTEVSKLSDAKVGSKIGNLMKCLEQHNTSNVPPAPPMMAVSSFVPVKIDPGKILKIESEGTKVTASTAKLLQPELVQKTVTEKKTLVRKKKVKKEKETGDANKIECDKLTQSVAEVQLHQKVTTTRGPTDERLQLGVLGHKIALKENDRTVIARHKVDLKHEAQLDGVSELQLVRQKLMAGAKGKEERVQVSETSTAVQKLETRDGMRTVKASGEQKKVVTMKSRLNGAAAEVRVEAGAKRTAATSEAPNPPGSLTAQIAARAAALAQQRRPSRCVYELDENDDSLLRQQQDAFDFSRLREKLERRLRGAPADPAEDAASGDNLLQKAAAIHALQSRLADMGNVRRAKKKWLTMERSLHQEAS